MRSHRPERAKYPIGLPVLPLHGRFKNETDLMKPIVLLLFLTVYVVPQHVVMAEQLPDDQHRRIDLWPKGRMPGPRTDQPEQHRSPERTDAIRLTHTNHPTLTLFPAQKAPDVSSPAVIICPGGGYNYVVMDKEGTEAAAWLNQNGVTALVLKYRTPDNRSGALQDLQRAFRITRANAEAWNINPQRLGVLGFSAGGHLAAVASTRFAESSYRAVDDADQQSCRPDFAVLVYPAYLKSPTGTVTSDLNLDALIPSTLLIHNEDDRRLVDGTKVYYTALKAKRGQHDFRLYPTGGHGYGLRCQQAAKVWPDDMRSWLQRIGVL